MYYKRVLFYRHRSTVTLLSSLLKAIATNRRLDQVFGLRFVEETLRVTGVQELLIAADAAATKELGDVVAANDRNIKRRERSIHVYCVYT